MTVTAFLFPGQGGKFVGQGKALHDSVPSVRRLFRLADEVTGKPVSKLCFEGPLDELGKTVNLQPAVLTVGLAAALAHMNDGRVPSYAAGHSLGEFAALALAGVLTEAEALQIVSKRAALMQKAAMQNPGTMAAILNLDEETLAGVVELASA